MPDGDKKKQIAFDTFVIDREARTLTRSGNRVQIQRKPLEVLIHLVQAAPRLVTRDELLQQFWSRAVNEEALTRCVSTIRKLLGDLDDPPRLIETHRAQGYRFIGTLSERGPAAPRSGKPIALAGAGAGVALLVVAGLAFAPRQTDVPPEIEYIDRVAVLPMGTHSSQPDWLSGALTDHLIHSMSRIEGITIVAPGTIAADTPVATVAERLGVDAVLSSRLTSDDAQTSLTAQLKSAPEGEILWSTRITSDAGLGASQINDLSRKVASRLRPAIQLQQAGEPVDPTAYRNFLRGRFFLSQRNAQSLYAAIESFEAALAIEPDYAEAAVGAAEAWLFLPLYGATPPIDSAPRARALAERAVALEPENPSAKAMLGAIAMLFEWKWEKAEELLSDAVAANPSDAAAHQWLGELNCFQRRFEECERRLSRAFELDPLSPVLNMQQGSVDFYAGNYQEALSKYVAAAAENPDFAMGRYVIGLAHAGLGQWDQAVTAYESVLSDLGPEVVSGPLAYALAQRGDTTQANAQLTELERIAAGRYVPPSKIAIAYLGLGKTAEAQREFLEAIEARDDRLVYFATDVHTRDLVGQAPFQAIAQQLGLER